MKTQGLDLIALILLLVIAFLLTLAFDLKLLSSVLLFFAMPSVYLMFKNPQIIRKSLIFAAIVSVPLSLFVDTLAAVNRAWIVPTTVFGLRLFGFATIEVYLFGFFWVLFSILFYREFLDVEPETERISSRIVYYIWLSAGLILYVAVGFAFDTRLLLIPYFYIVVGVCLVLVPLLLFLLFYPRFVKRFSVAGAYFFLVLLFFEIAALVTGQWIFPGEYLGLVFVFGYRIPVEEFLIWMGLSTPALLAYYEYFADDLL
jgi:hypothetical protein